MGGIWIAQTQTRLKKYDSALEDFKSHIDSRVKLKALLLDIINKNDIKGNQIQDFYLKKFVSQYFIRSYSENNPDFQSIISLAKNLQLGDIENLMILKFSEKELITERDFLNGHIIYDINA